MNDAQFDQALDALVTNGEPGQMDDLTRFVSDIYRKERAVTMPVHRKLQFASASEPTSFSGPASAPLGTRERRQSRRLGWLTIAAAALLAMTGIFNWSMLTGDHRGSFLGIPSAIPTVQATPVAMASPNAEWLMPISPYDCETVAEQIATPDGRAVELQAFPARVDYPLQQARYFPRMDAWNAARDMRACMNSVGIETFWSDRYTYEQYLLPTIDLVASGDIEADRILRGQVLSDTYQEQLGITQDALVLHFDVSDPEVEGVDPGTYPVINPDWILETADGRVIVLVTSMVVSDGELPLVTPDASQPGGLAWVLIETDGEWQIDEGLPVCFADEDACESFWRLQPGWATYVEMRTPRATPDISACSISDDFMADYEVSAGRLVNLRPGPGIQSGEPVVVIEDGQLLQYLCQYELTSDPEGDDLYEDQGWLFIRTEDGDEGWIREIDVRQLPIATP